ncbi:sensor histidine kinase [Pinirhizobacter soli]|uniref:sensor histidine kinase n=1 Tax=Pinirhizobacter soli TaxID=2786953 RepID=UPI002029DD84
MRSGLAISHSSWMRSLGVGTALVFAFWNLSRLRLDDTEQGGRLPEDHRRAERKRIARELHDTLLQGLQGILLEFEVLSLSLPEAERERAAKIERKLRHIVVDGRNAINALRLPDGGVRDWLGVVLELGEREASDSNADFMLKVKGEPWKLPAKMRIEVLAIVREGLRNAFDHSQADTIGVFVRYARRGLKITIHDNGIGVSEQHLQLRRKEGHWGIDGMRERAEKLRGRLTIASQPSSGTTVSLVVPRCLILMRSHSLYMSGKRWWGGRQA